VSYIAAWSDLLPADTPFGWISMPTKPDFDRQTRREMGSLVGRRTGAGSVIYTLAVGHT
jgi:hypothetical protein